MSLLTLLERSPDAAVAAGTVGIFLTYLEFNRPGLILPGATGLLLFLLSAAGLAHQPLNPSAVAALILSALVLSLGLRRRIPWLWALGATAGMVLGFLHLVRRPGERRVHLVTALLAGIFLGPGTFLLTGIARRARVNKGLD